MKIKSIEKAKGYGFKPIVNEIKKPTLDWSDATTDEDIDVFLAIEKVFEQEHIIVSDDSLLSRFDNHLAYDIGDSRRGQRYYILCNENTLELSLLATQPDGAGSDIALPDVLIEMVKNRDVV